MGEDTWTGGQANQRMNRQADGWMGEWMNIRADGQMDGRAGRWANRQMDGWAGTDGRADRLTNE